MQRCWWAGDDPLYIDYHDREWGAPCYDDARLFEMLLLESAQAGLSWITILRKRENYREAFDQFNVKKVARYGEADRERLLADAGIVRNRLKIASATRNAKIYLEIQKEFGSFSDYLWDFVGGAPQLHHFKSAAEVPATDEISDRLSRDMKKRGMNFVGSTICYAYMQSVGLVNDHLIDCPCHPENR
jgi:DNA-3-methyladenine glycosylase I